ncbi:MAG: alpha/beta hydrolase [Hyphomicrobiales bacterium]|nr:alpha/beta hydrolase [Hyphomicrobiales bacterium]
MLLKFVLAIAALPVVYVAIALALILSSQPVTQNLVGGKKSQGLDFTGTADQDLAGLAKLQSISVANTSPINFRFYKNKGTNKRLIVLIHGSGWHSMQYAAMANYLVENNLGHVVTPDLRGHGEIPDRRGDIDYIGQLEDDIAILVADLRTKYDVSQVIVGGHSSGGGLVIRLAGGKHGHISDGWVLFAPFIKHDAPTARPDAGGWAYPLVRRIIGLSMLNNIGIYWFNYLTAMQFNMPAFVRDGPLGHTATLAYSFRLNVSYAPRSNYSQDLASMKKPMLLLAGSNDEAFRPQAYQPTLSDHVTNGEYHILDGLGHIDLVNDKATFVAFKNWLAKM